METEHSRSECNYRRSLLAIAELIKAIVEISEQEVVQSTSQQQLADDFSATDL